ncbi:glycosyl transferase, partial [Paraclostridium benzoelyticum]|nr:glycosyl transferase [Paraclostridium benzoelyticum]
YIGGDKKYIINSDIVVTHKRVHGDSDRNLNIYKKKLKDGVKFSTRDIYYYGKELYYHGMHDEAIETFNSLLSEPIWIEEKIDIICKLSDCYGIKGNKDKSINILLSAFEIAPPRAEVIYRLGQNYEMLGRYYEAIYWYESIQNAKIPEDKSGFIYEELWSWKPFIQLCVCYNRIGDIDKAYTYHEKAKILQPKNEYVIQNSKFFESIGYIKN